MTNRVTLRAALASSALVAPMMLASAAQAQNVNVADLAEDCQNLVRISEELIDEVETREQLNQIAAADVDADCAVAVERFRERAPEIEAAATVEERAAIVDEVVAVVLADLDVAAAEVEAVRDIDAAATLEIERQAIVEGEVVVTQGAPEVQVGAVDTTVDVTPGVPEVGVTQLQPEIVVRQKQPTIRLAMPQPSISIQMPAPDIIVRMPDPEIAVTPVRPQVEVRQAEPTVAVSVPEPEVMVDVQARIVNPDQLEQIDPERLITGKIPEEIARIETTPDAEADIVVATAEPTVNIAEATEDAEIEIIRAEPTIRYEPAEPNVEIIGQPEINFEQVGEPNVVFETAGVEAQPAEEDAAVAVDVDAAAVEAEPVEPVEPVETEAEIEISAETRDILSATDPELAGAQEGQIAVRDLLGYGVVNAEGADLGDAERIVRNNGVLYLVVEHGGFLGIGGEEVALPMERVTLRGEQLVLEGLTEQDLIDMPAYDRGAELELGPEEMVDLGVL